MTVFLGWPLTPPRHHPSFLNASTLLVSPGATRLVASRCGGAVAAYAPRGRAAVSPLARGPSLAPPLPVGDGPLGFIEAAVFEVDAKARKGSPSWRFTAVARPPPRGRDAPPGAPRLLLLTITAAGRTVVSPLVLDSGAGRLKLLLAERGTEWVVAVLETGHVGYGPTAASALDMAATTWHYNRSADDYGDGYSDGGDRSFDGGDDMDTDSGRAGGSGGGVRRRSADADDDDDNFYADPRPCSAAAILLPRSLVVKLHATEGDGIVTDDDVAEGPAILFYTDDTGVRAYCPAADHWPNVPDDLASQHNVAFLAVMPGDSLLVATDRKPPLRATFWPGTGTGDDGVTLTPLDRSGVGPIEHAASDASATSVAATTQRGAAVLTAGVPTRVVAAAAPGAAPGLAALWTAAGPRGGGVIVASFADATRALAAAHPGAPLADVTTTLGLVADERSVAFGGVGGSVAAQVTPARVRLVSLDRLAQRRGQHDDADPEWLPPPGATIGAAAVAAGGVLVSTSDVRGVALLAVGMSEELQLAARCATCAEVSCLALAPATAPRSTTLALAGTYEPGAVLFTVTPVPGGITLTAVATLAPPPPPRVWGRGAAAAPPPPPRGGRAPPPDVPESVLLLPAPGGGAHVLVGWRSGALTHAVATPPPAGARSSTPWTLHPTAVARVGGLPLTLRPAPPGSGAAALAVGERAALVLPPRAAGRAATVVRLDVGAGARAAAPLPSADAGSMVVAYADGGLAVLAVEGGASSRLRVLPAGDADDVDSEEDGDDDEDDDSDAKAPRRPRKRTGHLGQTVCPLPACGAVAVACNWCNKFQTVPKGPTVEVVDVASGAVLATTELPAGCRVTSLNAWPPGPPQPGGGAAIRWDGGAAGPGLRVALEPVPTGVAPRGGASAPPLPPPPPPPSDGRAECCVAVSTEALDAGAASVFASGRYEAARRAGARRGVHGRVAVLALLRDARESTAADDPPPTWRLDTAADVLAPDPFTTLAILPDGGLAAGCGRRLAVLGHAPRLTTRATAAHARAAATGAIRLTRRGWVSVRHPPSWVGVATASDGRAVLAVADGEDGPLLCVRAGGAAAAGAAPPPRARPGAGDGTGWADDAALPVASGLVPRRATAAVPVAWPPGGGGGVPPAPTPPSARGGPPPPACPGWGMLCGDAGGALVALAPPSPGPGPERTMLLAAVGDAGGGVTAIVAAGGPADGDAAAASPPRWYAVTTAAGCVVGVAPLPPALAAVAAAAAAAVAASRYAPLAASPPAASPPTSPLAPPSPMTPRGPGSPVSPRAGPRAGRGAWGAPPPPPSPMLDGDALAALLALGPAARQDALAGVSAEEGWDVGGVVDAVAAALSVFDD